MERKILTLPSFLADSELGKKNYTTWVMQMEVVLESYDLTFMVLQDFPHPMVQIEDTSNNEESSARWSESELQAYKWDWLNAWIRSFIALNCTPTTLHAHRSSPRHSTYMVPS